MSTRPGGPFDTTKSKPVSGVRAVVLVGFMGAGKSSVGTALSRRLGWPFEDLDERIQAREQRSIEQIFRQSGEAAFRKLEHESLRLLVGELNPSARVIALGGGASRRRTMPPCSKRRDGQPSFWTRPPRNYSAGAGSKVWSARYAAMRRSFTGSMRAAGLAT